MVQTSKMRLRVSTFIFLACLCKFGVLVDNGEKTCGQLFDDGVDAFESEKWDECVFSFESALRSFLKSKDLQVVCRRSCDEVVASSTSSMVENLKYLEDLERYVKKSLCILRCDFVDSDFDKWRTYEYLQHCYFQNNQLQKAASAAYTFLASNPDHEAMSAMLKFYTTQPGISIANITNLETQPLTTAFREGLEAYKHKDFGQAIEFMEQSLDLFMAAEERCRTDCANSEPDDVELLPVHDSPMISEIAGDLKCKRKCGTSMKKFPANIFKYLHFAFFKVGDHVHACEALASYQLFRPKDDNVASIMAHYQGLAQVAAEDCVPRQSITKYVSRQNYEEQLLQEIQQRIGSQDQGVNEIKVDDSLQRRSMAAEDDLNDFDESAEVNAIRESFMKNTQLLKSGAELNGVTRFLAQGLTSEEECRQLIGLAKTVAAHGHGYVRNDPTPFSEREVFQMINFERAELMAYFGVVDQVLVDKFFEIADRAKLYLEKQFNLQGKLYLEACNLHCKTPLNGSNTEEGTELPLSQAFHADNCLKQEDGVTCLKNRKDEWRDYSSIIYLNDDFDGGEFVFSSNFSVEGVQAEVAPHCGHNVGFSSGPENIHGIRGVAGGPRCALVNFYTVTPARNCQQRVRAQMFWDRARLGSVSDQAVRRLDHDRDFS